MALPHLWAPLLVLFAGLVVTGLTAQALEEQSRSLAEQVYRKQHNALVARLRGYDELPPLYTDGVAPARTINNVCLLYTSPSPRDLSTSRMPSSA